MSHELQKILKHDFDDDYKQERIEFNLHEPLSPVKPPVPKDEPMEISESRKRFSQIGNGYYSSKEVIEFLRDSIITYNDLKCMFDTTSSGPFYVYVDQEHVPLIGSFFLVKLIQDLDFEIHKLFTNDGFHRVFFEYLKFMYGESKSHLPELYDLLQTMQDRNVISTCTAAVMGRIDIIEKAVVPCVQYVFCDKDVESFVFGGKQECDPIETRVKLELVRNHIHALFEEAILILPGTVENMQVGYAKCYSIHVRNILSGVDLKYGSAALWNAIDVYFSDLISNRQFTAQAFRKFEIVLHDWRQALHLLKVTESSSDLLRKIEICEEALLNRANFARQLLDFCDNSNQAARDVIWPFLPSIVWQENQASIYNLYLGMRLHTYLKRPNATLLARNMELLSARFGIIDMTAEEHRRVLYGSTWTEAYFFFKRIVGCLREAETEKIIDLSMVLPVCFIRSVISTVQVKPNDGLAMIRHRMKMCNMVIRDPDNMCECNAALDIAIFTFRYIHENETMLLTTDILECFKKDFEADIKQFPTIRSRKNTVSYIKKVLSEREFLALYDQGEKRTIKEDCGLLLALHSFNLVQLYLSTLQQFNSRPEVMDLEVAACLCKLDGVFTRYDNKGCRIPDCNFRKVFRKLHYNAWGAINGLHEIAKKCEKVEFDTNPLATTFQLLRDEGTCPICQNLCIMLFLVAYVIEN